MASYLVSNELGATFLLGVDEGSLSKKESIKRIFFIAKEELIIGKQFVAFDVEGCAKQLKGEGK